MKTKSIHDTTANTNIEIQGARAHNLKNISLQIPRQQLVVVTGPSGCGKSSLLYDTIYMEAQRRYLESILSMNKSFMQPMTRPEVERITGLSPAILLDQKTTTASSKSTLATIADVYDYLRLLFAHLGQAHSPKTKLPMGQGALQDFIAPYFCADGAFINELTKSKKWNRPLVALVLAPLVVSKNQKIDQIISRFAALGFQQVRVNGVYRSIDDKMTLKRTGINQVCAVVGKVKLEEGREGKCLQLLEESLVLSKQQVMLDVMELSTVSSIGTDKKQGELQSNQHQEFLYSTQYFCPELNRYFPAPTPNLFSFFSPQGQCPTCLGKGTGLSLIEEHFQHCSNLEDLLAHPLCAALIETEIISEKKFQQRFLNLVSSIAPKTSLQSKLNPELLRQVLHHPQWGLLALLQEHVESGSPLPFEMMSFYVEEGACTSCQGSRLNDYARHFTYRQLTLFDIGNLSLGSLREWLKNVSAQLPQLKDLKGQQLKRELEIKLIKTISDKVSFLCDVGLNYLTLFRPGHSLSGGEIQRVRLTAQLGPQLSGLIYLLDEPSIGLHPRDTHLLIQSLRKLTNLGNTVLVIEHDLDTIRAADHIIDLGPASGPQGGTICFSGDFASYQHSEFNLLKKQWTIKEATQVRIAKEFFSIVGAKRRNLKNISINLPLDILCVITGVSGSGKSSLIFEEFIPRYLKVPIKERRELIIVDQKPVGRTSKSIVATYCGLLDELRKFFAATTTAKMLMLKDSHFSFNSKLGQCIHCKGSGLQHFDIAFLDDASTPCPYCQGKRFNEQVLQVNYRGHHMAQLLQLTIDEAYELLGRHPKVAQQLLILKQVGLGYVSLVKHKNTLSGGETQRLKLSKELSKKKMKPTLYIFDEPSTGLHLSDLERLYQSFELLIDQGHGVMVIEHNTDFIRKADYIIDLGPDGGDGGGEIVFAGTPRDLKEKSKSALQKFI